MELSKALQKCSLGRFDGEERSNFFSAAKDMGFADTLVQINPGPGTHIAFIEFYLASTGRTHCYWWHRKRLHKVQGDGKCIVYPNQEKTCDPKTPWFLGSCTLKKYITNVYIKYEFIGEKILQASWKATVHLRVQTDLQECASTMCPSMSNSG